jgi:FlgD Ig-like domain
VPRSRLFFVLCVLALASGLTVPRSASAGFSQSWANSGWRYQNLLGNTDADFSYELMFVNKVDGRYGIFDGTTGALEKDFTAAYSQTNATYYLSDFDGDDRYEVILQSHPHIAPAFFRAYRWNGADYVTFITHSDPVASFGGYNFRTAGQQEIGEVSDVIDDPTGHPTCDFRIRDQAGTVLFRASTNIAGWSQPLRSYTTIDRNNDGVQELILEDQNKAYAFQQYSGTFSLAWTLTGWSRLVELGNVDTDPQSEFLATKNVDGTFAVVDGTTGAIQQEFAGSQYPATAMGGQNTDGDSRLELIVHKLADGLTPPVYSIYDWNGSSFVPLVTVTASSVYSNFGVLQLRSPAQFEIAELADADLLLHDLSGTVLFRASTDVPGWSVTPFELNFNFLDADHSGMPDLLLYDNSHVWDIRYSGTFAPAWAANGHGFLQEMGNLDADAQSEVMLCKVADSTFVIFDGVTGTSQQTFSNFKFPTSYFVYLDTDDDDRPELYFGRQQGAPPLFTAYKWNGSTYAPLYSHTQAMGQWGPVQLRRKSQFEFLEVDNTDIRVRDVAAPTVLFRASTDLPGWSGLPYAIASPGIEYPHQPDVYNLFIFDDAQFRVVLHQITTEVPGPAGITALRVTQNTPNPFRTSTAFRVTNPREGEVGVRIFDASGRLVRRLDRRLPAGASEIRWDGRDDRGRNAPSGVLFYEVTVDGARQTRKLIRVE